jgi:hypothetical protein
MKLHRPVPAQVTNSLQHCSVLHPPLAVRCGLTGRSTGPPAAGHQARSGGTRYIFASPGLASCRRRPVNSALGRIHTIHSSSTITPMGKIVEFPSLPSRQWAEWERQIYAAAQEQGIPESVVQDAVPRLKAHWEVVFEAVSLELPERPVPGRLTRDQATAIQSIIDDASGVVLDRLRHERSVAFQRLIIVELALSRAQLG